MTKDDVYKELYASTMMHWDRFGKIWPIVRTWDKPKVVINPRTFRVAGCADYDNHTIEYSFKLFPYHINQFHNVIVPHEIAHIVCEKIYKPRQHHGPEWKNIMVQYGLKPDPYHKMTYPPKDNK